MPGTNLTRAEATERSTMVRAESYDVKLDLTLSEETFRSETVVKFAAAPGDSTFIDLIAPKVHEIELNGEKLDPAIHQDSRIPLQNLQAENTLHVIADCAFMHTGEGMHRFVDPTDNEAYVYTQFEVPDSRRVFTVFEQPDQKATFTFTVRVPEHWTVLSNAPTPQPEKHGDGTATFAFPTGPKISSYITAIVAGPYASAHSTVKSVDGRVLDTAVYARSSMMKYMDPDNVFELTQQGFAFFEKMYGQPYPFDKYDHIFVPEYNAGAMENAGCITYTEAYVFTSTPTENVVEARANTILHELAHMWFGDLITMKWWNDLWLNESFAEFMSHLACAEATRFTDAWVGFGSRKLWGMAADQLPTTHPIVAPIKDLADVEVNFDGITYAKGACVLRQLVAYIGRDAFEKGLQSYFEKYKWGNTELQDLLNEFAAASGKDIDAWAKVWLEEAGITQLVTEVEYAGDEVAQLAIRQELVMDNTSLRPQSTQITGLKLVADKYEVLWTLPVEITEARTVVNAATGLQRPDVVLLNSSDEAYAKIRFDAASLAHVSQHIGAIQDATMRAVVVMMLWDMCRDGELPAAEMIAAALADLRTEKQSTIAQILLQSVVTALQSYSRPAEREALAAKVGAQLVELLEQLPAGSSIQQQVADTLVNVAVGDQLDVVANFAAGESINGLEIGDKLRWSALVTLAASGKDIDALLAAQVERDPSLAGEEFKAAVISQQDLKATWQLLFTDDSLSTGKIQQLLRFWHLNAWRHADELPDVYADFWERIVPLWSQRTFHIASRILELIFPVPLAGIPGSYDVAARGHAWLEANSDQSDALKRLVAEGIDKYQRALKAQQA